MGMNANTELHGAGVRLCEPLTRSGLGRPVAVEIQMGKKKLFNFNIAGKLSDFTIVVEDDDYGAVYHSTTIHDLISKLLDDATGTIHDESYKHECISSGEEQSFNLRVADELEAQAARIRRYYRADFYLAK